MDNIIQFILAYDNTVSINDYYNEICDQIQLEPNFNKNDMLFAVIDILIKKHDSADILTYDYIIPLLEYIIKQVRLNGVITSKSGMTLIDTYKEILPRLYPDSGFAKHVNRYIESVSLANNMMSLFNIKTPVKQTPHITMDDLLKRIEKLENEVLELKSRL
jgi:hypothetical protein